jgi:hypothetical protein
MSRSRESKLVRSPALDNLYDVMVSEPYNLLNGHGSVVDTPEYNRELRLWKSQRNKKKKRKEKQKRQRKPESATAFIRGTNLPAAPRSVSILTRPSPLPSVTLHEPSHRFSPDIANTYDHATDEIRTVILGGARQLFADVIADAFEAQKINREEGLSLAHIAELELHKIELRMSAAIHDHQPVSQDPAYLQLTDSHSQQSQLLQRLRAKRVEMEQASDDANTHRKIEELDHEIAAADQAITGLTRAIDVLRQRRSDGDVLILGKGYDGIAYGSPSHIARAIHHVSREGREAVQESLASFKLLSPTQQQQSLSGLHTRLDNVVFNVLDDLARQE